MSPRDLAAAILIVSFVGASPAQEPPSIDKLIEQLGSKSFPVRERATKALRERGVAALPAVRKALESKDEEVRKRAEGLIPAMEIDDALMPKRVSLKVVDANLTTIFADLQKQTGYTFSTVGKVTAGKRTIDLKDTPFWEALEKLTTADEKIAVAMPPINSRSVRREAPLSLAPANNRGPFRVEAAWFHEDRDIDLSKIANPAEKQRDSRLTLSLTVLAEPRITFLKIGAAKVEEAVDSDGKSLLEVDQPGNQPISAPGRSTFRGESLTYSDVRLQRAGESAKSLKLVRGTIPVKMILIRKPYVVTNKILQSVGTKFVAGTDGLEITRVTNQGGGSVEVEISVPRQQNSDERWYDRFELEDDAGNRFQSQGSGSRSDGRGYWISKYFGSPFNKKVGPPTKLILDQWIIHEFNIPFEFRDLPMP